MEDDLEKTGKNLDFEIDRGEDDIERELRRLPKKSGNKGGRRTAHSDAGFELFGPSADGSESEIDLESGSCDFNLGSAITAERGRSETPKSSEYGKTRQDSSEKTKKQKDSNKEGTGEELSEEEKERRALLVQRIRQIMASKSGRIRGDDLRRMLGGSGMSFDDAVQEVVKSYGRALSDDDEGSRDSAVKKETGISPVFEAYASKGSGGKSPYAMRERELHSDVYSQTGTADVSPDKALKKMRGPYADESR